MGSLYKPEEHDIEIIDPYVAPEFFITHVPKWEPAGDGVLRAYLCVKRSNVYEVRALVVMPIASIVAAAKSSMVAAAEAHNASQFKLDS